MRTTVITGADPQPPVPEMFLRATDVVDHQTRELRALALALREGDAIRTAYRCFQWVFDFVSHSIDAGRSDLTWKASDVLRLGTGLCFAKSHLLAALLRANGIPAGFGYSRLRRSETEPQFVLHGFNVVWLPGIGPYRVDARGLPRGEGDDRLPNSAPDSEEALARFAPPVEHLAYPADLPGEYHVPGVWSDPWPCVLGVLQSSRSVEQAVDVLPDVPLRIGLATEQDLPIILELQRLAFSEEVQRYRDPGLAPMTQTLEQLATEARSSVVLAARVEGWLVGSVRGRIDGQGIGHVGRLVVHPEWRRRGVASKLMDTVEASLSKCRAIRVFTGDRSDHALTLYRRRGYVPCGRMSNGSHDLVLLERVSG